MMKLGYVVLFVLLISCGEHKKYNHCSRITLDDFAKPVLLESEIVDLDEPVMRPLRIYAIDSFLITKEDESEFLLQKYNINSWKKVGECFTFGSGPNEFLWIQSLQLVNSYIWLADGQNASISQFRKEDVLLLDSTNVEAVRKISFEDHFRYIVVLPDGQFAALAYNINHKRLSFYDFEGNLVKTKGEYPDYGDKLTEVEKLEGFSCNMILSPHKDHIFLFYMQTDLIEIYDLAGNLEQRLHGPDYFYPAVNQVSQGDVLRVSSVDGESRDGYFSPVVVNDKVYVLYSGEYYDRNKGSSLQKNLFVFDNEGTPVKRYLLNTPIYNFTIDSKENFLYGLSNDPEFHVVRYKLD